jgi:hypothetical protein
MQKERELSVAGLLALHWPMVWQAGCQFFGRIVSVGIVVMVIMVVVVVIVLVVVRCRFLAEIIIGFTNH